MRPSLHPKDWVAVLGSVERLVAGRSEFHRPVMVEVVVDLFKGVQPGVVLDATVGGGGHAEEVLSRCPGLRLIGLDQDPEAVEYARARLRPFGDRVRVRKGNFADLAQILLEEGVEELKGLFFDLGISLHQVESPERGFSYRLDGPLDMRMDPSRPVSVLGLIRGGALYELMRVIREYGEEPGYRRIARAIYESRDRLKTTSQLARIVAECVPRSRFSKARARVFQALRIWVNDELRALERGLSQGIDRLARGGVVVAIAYHSLEDRIVKREFRARMLSGELQILTRRPLRPAEEEVGRNPAARSARLRAARKVR